MVKDKRRSTKTSNSIYISRNLVSEFQKLKNKWEIEQFQTVLNDNEIKVELLVKQLRELILFLVNSGLNYTEYGRYKLPTVNDSFKKLLLRQGPINDCMKGRSNLNEDDIDEISSRMENINFNGDSGSYCSSDLNNCLGNRLDSFPLYITNKTLSKNEFLKIINSSGCNSHRKSVLQELNNVLWQKKSAFYEYDKKLGHYNGPLKMNLKIVDGMSRDSKHVKQSNSLDKQLEMGIYIYNLLREGIIEPSVSPILSPPNLIKSEGTKTQFSGRFGNVNEIL
uniref:DUF4806 domain-containing protein n=1 Tax=Strongyloides venezuelensis TaxID=75913 RepID=A0A0K0FGM4_STRVS